MAAETPIAGMQHNEAVRSFLLQLKQMSAFRAELDATEVEQLTDEEALALCDRWGTYTYNIERTMARIQETYGQ